MGMSRYYRNIFGVPKDYTPPPPPEIVTVIPPPVVEEVEVVMEEPEPIVEKKPAKAVAMKKIGAKKKK